MTILRSETPRSFVKVNAKKRYRTECYDRFKFDVYRAEASRLVYSGIEHFDFPAFACSLCRHNFPYARGPLCLAVHEINPLSDDGN